GICDTMLRMARISSILFLAAACVWGAESSPATADQILKDLLAGNQRYVAQKATHPHQDPARRAALAKTQNPGAVILGCSDSRVGPELVFDQGLGDLFVVRDAGNTINDVVFGQHRICARASRLESGGGAGTRALRRHLGGAPGR